MLATNQKNKKVTTADLTELVKGSKQGIEEEKSNLRETMEAVLTELLTMKKRSCTSKTQPTKAIRPKKDGMTMSKEEMKAFCMARSLKVSGTMTDLERDANSNK